MNACATSDEALNWKLHAVEILAQLQEMGLCSSTILGVTIKILRKILNFDKEIPGHTLEFSSQFCKINPCSYTLYKVYKREIFSQNCYLNLSVQPGSYIILKSIYFLQFRIQDW